MNVLLTGQFDYADEFYLESLLMLQESVWEDLKSRLENLVETSNDPIQEVYFGTNEFLLVDANTFLSNVIVQDLTDIESYTISLLIGEEFGTIRLQSIINTLLGIEDE
jgi:hypothetical protein